MLKAECQARQFDGGLELFLWLDLVLPWFVLGWLWFRYL
jgi:hypothetical protein